MLFMSNKNKSRERSMKEGNVSKLTSEAGLGPMYTASSASFVCSLKRSASLYTATVFTPNLRAVRITRQAISPLFAIRILSNNLFSFGWREFVDANNDGENRWDGRERPKEPTFILIDLSLFANILEHRKWGVQQQGVRMRLDIL